MWRPVQNSNTATLSEMFATRNPELGNQDRLRELVKGVTHVAIAHAPRSGLYAEGGSHKQYEIQNFCQTVYDSQISLT